MSQGGMVKASGTFMSGARLDVLDGFRLCCAGRELLPRPGEQRLLAFLAVRTKADRALVAGTLWPEVTDWHAIGSLRTALWRGCRPIPGPPRSAAVTRRRLTYREAASGPGT